MANLEATGARMPQRQRYYARLVAGHDARDMAAYRIALNGYVEAAGEAYRKTKRGLDRMPLSPGQRQSEKRGLT